MALCRPNAVHIEKRDARNALAALPPRSFSVLVTDPPYSTVARRGHSGHLRRWFAASLSWREIGETLALARSRMRPEGIAFVMTNPDGLPEAIKALERASHAGHTSSHGRRSAERSMGWVPALDRVHAGRHRLGTAGHD
ncbi:MAG: hypothetical protein ABSC46_06430 [Candidatus Limnocylindrales bacterium]|jgi:tRNA1(Val) A37 N6-methylase TrmN6